MKRITTLVISLLLLLPFVTSCDALRSVSSNKINSQGAPYELIIVCNQPEWEGALGDTLRAIFTAPIPYLAQTEPYFDVLRVTERGYTNLVTKHRNILDIDFLANNEPPRATVQYDLNATPQVVVTLTAPSAEAATQYLSDNRTAILDLYESAERDRSIDYAKKFGVVSLETMIRKKFGFEMKIPEGYVFRAQGDDYLWLSYEYPTASQGIVIYSYPATKGAKSLSCEDLTAARNRFVANIPGPSDGSYMTTFMEYPADYRTFRLEGRLWAEMRGLWDLVGDYMGGPYVSFSTINTDLGEVVTIDCYVYSPKLPKRNFLRGVDHLIHNVSFLKE